MITPTQQYSVANPSPTFRRPVAKQLPTNRNPFPISWQSIAHQSPTGRRFLEIDVADQTPIDLQPKLIVQWLHWLQLLFSRKAVADRLQYMGDRGLIRLEIELRIYL